jgi:iron complex outermembrane receptor protein
MQTPPAWPPIRLQTRTIRHRAVKHIAGYLLLWLLPRLPLWGSNDDDAQKNLRNLSLEQLGNIQVTTVSKQPVKVNRTPAAIFVITADDIRRSGITSFPEILRLAPGVQVARIDAVKWSIGIRGFGSRLSRSILVLIDGRTVYSPLFHGVYWEVQDTLLEDVERIEVIRGPGGTIWGANAVNGVINIITKSAKDTHGSLVSAGGGDLNQALADVRYGGGSGNFNYRIYGKETVSGPEFHPNNAQFDDWRRTQAGFRTDSQLSQRDSLTVQGDIYTDEAGESTQITSLSAPFARIVNENAELSGGNILARWRRDLGGGSDFQLQTYFDRENRSQSSQAEYRDTFDIDFVHHLTLWGKQDFQWGLGARISLGNVPQIVATYFFTPDYRTDQLYSAFIQDDIPVVGDELRLTLGSKIIHSAFDGLDAEPTVRLLWAPTTRRTIWAAVTRAVRTPSDLEEDLESYTLAPPNTSNLLTFTHLTGNGKFQSERLIGYEAGYRSLLAPRFSIDVAAYFNSYDHLLSVERGTSFLVDAPMPYLVIPITDGNGLRGHTAGFEIAPNWKPTDWWRIQGSYSYLHMDLNTQPGSTDITTVASTEGSSPHHEGTVESYFDVSRSVELNVAFRVVSALPALNVKTYETGDVRFGWHPGHHFEFSVTGQNLLQPHHVEYNGDPGTLVGIKRDVFATLTWRQ